MKHVPTVLALALCASAGPLLGQDPLSVRTAVVFERYTFDAGLSFSEVSELTIPVTATWRFGRRGDVTLSTGFVRVAVTDSAPTARGAELSGALDTEARFTLSVVPDRVMLVLSGRVPTGQGTVRVADVGALRALATDVIGFAASSLGTGGSVGGGIVAAVPLGSLALGLAGHYDRPLAYEPILGIVDELRPGAELRLRGGLSGAIGPRSYLRITGLFARRGRDRLGEEMGHGIGNRYAGYLTLDQGVGSATLTLYAFDMFRADPQIEQTAIGGALFPRGNVLGAGAQLSFALGRDTRFTPRAEFRGAWEAASPDETELQRKGSSLRFGADLRQRLAAAWSLTLQADGVTGDIVESGPDIGFRGFRVAAYLETTLPGAGR